MNRRHIAKKLFINQRRYYGKLINLHDGYPGSKTVTVYVKGFLSRGETAKDFTRWSKSHYENMKWDPLCFGYVWQNQHFTSHFSHVLSEDFSDKIPSLGRQIIPIPVLTMTNIALRLIWKRRFFTNPYLLVGSLAVDTGLICRQIYEQYNEARANAREHAPKFTEELVKLRDKLGPKIKVRVVAHSLGCQLAIRAMDQNLVDELHLLAPAITSANLEEIIDHHNGKIPVDKIRIYYSDHDYILRIFEWLEDGNSIGLRGVDKKLLESHPNLDQIDVTDYLDGPNKHKSFSWTFNKFVN